MDYTLTTQTLWTQSKNVGVGEGIQVINIVSHPENNNEVTSEALQEKKNITDNSRKLSS